MVDEWKPVGTLDEWPGQDVGDICDLFVYEGWEQLTPDAWLWCLHCGRLQQVRTVRFTEGGFLLCSFEDCDGSLIDLWECDDPQHEGAFPEPSERVSGAIWPIYGSPPEAASPGNS